MRERVLLNANKIRVILNARCILVKLKNFENSHNFREL
jgi:hypothetical protein